MPRVPWTAERIKSAAQRTGKPLETKVIQAFHQADWTVAPSTYYVDLVTEAVREVDVMAVKSKTFTIGAREGGCFLQAFISCKGVPDGHRAVTYVIPYDNLPYGFVGRALSSPTSESMDAAAKGWAEQLMSHTGQGQARLIGFDVYEATDKEIVPRGDRSLKGGEGSLYPGMDSAIKAALYWRQLTLGMSGEFRCLILPILVLSKPWFEIPIRGDNVGEPVEQETGHFTAYYPSDGNARHPEPITALVCSVSKLEGQIKRLDKVFIEFAKAFEERKL